MFEVRFFRDESRSYLVASIKKADVNAMRPFEWIVSNVSDTFGSHKKWMEKCVCKHNEVYTKHRLQTFSLANLTG